MSEPVHLPPCLPPQARTRSLAHLRVEIARSEAVRARWAARLDDVVAAGLDAAWPLGMLRLVEQRLERLRRSGDVLMSGDPGANDNQPADR